MKRFFVFLFVISLVPSLWAGPKRDASDILPDYAHKGEYAFPYAAQIDDFLRNQSKTRIRPSGVDSDDYLQLIARQVEVFRNFQDGSGAIIDPVYKIEWQYSTPCYALSVALLNAAGRITESDLFDSGVKAMSCAVDEMYENRCAHNHGEFFIQPIMMAMDLYEGVVPDELSVEWKNKIATVDPYLLYKDNLNRKKKCYNHNVVALAGEYLRVRKGIDFGGEFFERHMKHQEQYMSDNGMYIDNPTNPPMVYDEFTRQFLASIMVEGYDGPSHDFYCDRLLNGAWTSLFMQSPYGEVPCGGRSAQHIWNEAAAAVTYEIYAAQYQAAGRSAEARAFKRAAHKSIQSIMRWGRPDGSGYIVKNRYPIEAMHGYESYSAQSQYNLLACWLMAVAYLYADDSIPEAPAPSDVGGYVIPMTDVYHKVFANAAGNYVEYELSADPRYNATGIVRIHLKNSNPQIGPSDAIPRNWDKKKRKDLGGELMAVGPAWKDRAGNEHRLAEYTNMLYANDDPEFYSKYPKGKTPDVQVDIDEQSPERVCFTIVYKGEFNGATTVRERIVIDRRGVTVEDSVEGDVAGMRVYYPMLVFDGMEHAAIRISKDRMKLSLRDGSITFKVLSPSDARLQRTGRELSFRNGMAEGLYFDASGNKATYRISK